MFFFEQVFIISQTHCTGAAVFQGFEVDCERFVLLKFSRFFFSSKNFQGHWLPFSWHQPPKKRRLWTRSLQALCIGLHCDFYFIFIFFRKKGGKDSGHTAKSHLMFFQLAGCLGSTAGATTKKFFSVK